MAKITDGSAASNEDNENQPLLAGSNFGSNTGNYVILNCWEVSSSYETGIKGSFVM